MFMFHVALSLALIALTAGCALFVFSSRCEGKGTCFAKTIAVIVILLSILSSLCVIYFGVKTWQQSNGHCSMCNVCGMQDKAMTGDDNSMNMTNEKKNINQSKTASHTH